VNTKRLTRGGLGVVFVVAVVAIAAALLVPGFATVVGRLVGDLWVTVMAAVVGILGAFLGS
jgi:hypothetical protein